MKQNLTIDHGLIVDTTTEPPTCCGYIFNFGDKGAYSPDGKVTVNGVELSQDRINEHNRLLGHMEMAGLKKHGRGTLYLTHADDGTWWVGTWASKGGERMKVYHTTTSFHNMAGRDGRRDVWFMLDGSRWHGVHIGDNQLVRVKRCKA